MLMQVKRSDSAQTMNLWQQIRLCHRLLNLYELILFPRTTFEEKRQPIAQPLALQEGLIARQEVPFECWLYNHDSNLETCVDTLKARAWGVVALFEGSVRTGIEAIAYLITKLAEVTIYTPEHSSERRLDVLQVQWTGVRLGAYSLWSPKAAAIRAHHLAGKGILATTSRFPWGTQYKGERRVFRPITSGGYPWPGKLST